MGFMSDAKSGKIKKVDWNKAEQESYFMKMDVNSVAIIHLPRKELYEKEFEKPSKKPYFYYLLYSASFLKYSGEQEVHPDEDNLVLQINQGTVNAIKEEWDKQGNDIWEYIVIYRETERTSKAKIIDKEELDKYLSLSYEELIKSCFGEDCFLSFNRIKNESQMSPERVQSESLI